MVTLLVKLEERQSTSLQTMCGGCKSDSERRCGQAALLQNMPTNTDNIFVISTVFYRFQWLLLIFLLLSYGVLVGGPCRWLAGSNKLKNRNDIIELHLDGNGS